MKKIFSIAILCGCVLAANAVPAKRGWQTRTQADGTTIEVQQLGDEYYHYLLNRDGQEVRLNEAGMYEVVGEAENGMLVNDLAEEADIPYSDVITHLMALEIKKRIKSFPGGKFMAV